WAAEQIVDVIVSLMVPPVSCLLLLIVGNVVVRWVAPRAALTPTELVIIYGMLQVATAIAAEWMWVINPLIASFSVFKERNTKFGKYLLPNLPNWLFLKDPAQIPDYQTGGRGLLDFFGQLH